MYKESSFPEQVVRPTLTIYYFMSCFITRMMKMHPVHGRDTIDPGSDQRASTGTGMHWNLKGLTSHWSALCCGQGWVVEPLSPRDALGAIMPILNVSMPK